MHAHAAFRRRVIHVVRAAFRSWRSFFFCVLKGSRFIEDRSVSQLLLYIIEETGQVDTASSKQSGFQQQPP